MVDTVVLPPIVDSQGNLRPHGQSGVLLPLTFNDKDGQPRDVSADELYFVVKGRVKLALLPGSVPSERVLRITKSDLALIGKPAEGSEGRPFVLINETPDPEVPNVEWEGLIGPREFVGETIDG